MTYYEIKKVLSKKGSKIALAVILAVMMVTLYFAVNDIFYVNEKGETEYGLSSIAKQRELKKEWAGELTEEKIRKVIEENVAISRTPEALSESFQENDKAFAKKQGFMDIRSLMAMNYSGFRAYNYNLPDSLSPEAASEFYPNRIKSLKEWLETEAKGVFSEKEQAYLIKTYETLKTPLYYDYQGGWTQLIQYLPTIIMIGTLVLGFLCAGIFSGEFQRKASAVLYSSFHGRKKAVAAKIRAGMIVATSVYWGAVLLFTGLILGIFGADGAGCPIQSVTMGWKSMYHLTNLQEYLLIVLGGYAGCLFMLLLTMLVSAKTNSAVTAVMIPFALILLPSFFTEMNAPALEKVLGLLPNMLLMMSDEVKLFHLYEIGGCVVPAVPILLIVYTVLSVMITPLIYRTYRKKQVYE